MQTLTVKILCMTDEMKASLAISAILQSSANVRGQYVIPVVDLCSVSRNSPLEVDTELQQFAKAKLIEFSYAGDADFFYVRRELDDESYDELLGLIFQQLAKEEEETDHQFDVLFTLLREPDELDNIVASGEPSQLSLVPHAAVNEEMVKRMIALHKRSRLTPRAIARILHGITSPAFGFAEWSRTPFWGAQAMASFVDIMKFCRNAMLSSG
jgi:hypothetical protein